MDEYQVKITLSATLDLQEILRHISTQLLAPLTAEKMLNTFHEAIASLYTMPKRNPFASDKFLANLGYRIMPVKNYLVFYTVTDWPAQEVNIERILYGKRDWQQLLNPS
ncbi:MAG: type II toxin-antitoxin system RelE/ParE family toxin [Defluviitaleaceae bacterium]|nr:type II toxin-antitoxin system RelE/ParE family toxin [Defluviitaleaceae bacterium]